jgi:hypothetical protein
MPLFFLNPAKIRPDIGRKNRKNWDNRIFPNFKNYDGFKNSPKDHKPGDKELPVRPFTGRTL